MFRGHRPSAFDVSFPEEAAIATSSQGTTRSASGSLKRKNDGLNDSEEIRAPKRQQLPPVDYYKPQDEEVVESDRLVIAGEDLDEGYDSDDDNEGHEPDKPIRVLSNFSIFDPIHRNEMVSLSTIEEDDGVDRQFEGAGYVTPHFINEEDEGQEDGLDVGLQYIRLGAILRYTFDYTKEGDPVYIETEFAWYILKTPSLKYQPYFKHFYTPRRIAQLVISSVVKRPQQSYDAFLRKFVTMVDTFGRTYQEQHLWESVLDIQDAIDDCEDPRQLRSTLLVKTLLRKVPSASADRTRPARRRNAPTRGPPPINSLIGNPDLAVLKAENQTPTHVTPCIAALAQDLVTEELIVLGPRPPPPNKGLLEAEAKAAHVRLCHAITMAKVKRKMVDVQRKDRYSPNSRYLKAIEINHEKYHVGDFIIVPIGQTPDHPAPCLPDNVSDVKLSSTFADYFWFARIMYINIDLGKVHIQWLEHGSHTVMEELAHPQELFYTDLCTSIEFQLIAGKVVVHERPKLTIPPEEFFVRFVHDRTLSTFKSIDDEQRKLFSDQLPPDNCYVCFILEDRSHKDQPSKLKNKQGIFDGVAYGGHNYHYEDFVLYRAEEGPAHIGYITDIRFPVRETSTSLPAITVKRVGRVNDILHIIPTDVVKDERHVFLTDDEITIPITKLIRVCFVFPYDSIPDLADWLSLSQDHFYIRFAFPSLSTKSWNDKRDLSFQDLPVCTSCVEQKLEERRSMLEFLEQAQKNPLPTLDLFAGAGAFSHGMAEGSGCMKLSHAIEISPSAAKTVKRNSPGTLVYNQCVNNVLRYCIKRDGGHETAPLQQLYDPKIDVPDWIRRHSIHILLAGFPCQSHSALNMYKRADDIKSNLVLTTLSYVDHFRPKICYFENVPGFLAFTFNATQAGKYKLEGGIPMGGLKFTVRALIELGYQVGFGLMQAGNYGAPQGRVRFFIVAAVDGHPLPELPQPTHDFPVVHNLQIKHPLGGKPIRPIRTDRGIAPHAYVTIDDAISDLPRFDWKHPRISREPAKKQHEIRERERRVRTFECNHSSSYCGYKGNVEYHHPPRTTYQLFARSKPTRDLQHFTKCLLPKKVERVVSIPLAANADYRSLRSGLMEWQVANPLSSIAKKNFRPGIYGRLDQNGYFPTTVTNIDPTAKQSKVLNPYCKRMVTVRELARSQGFPDHFVFESINNNVVTMHRQIGNAVPWQVGSALGRELRIALYKKWLKSREDAIEVD